MGGTRGGIKGGESVADALAELTLSASQCNSATVDPQLRVSTNQNPHTNDPQRSSLVRTRLCLTVRESIEEGSGTPLHYTNYGISPPMGGWGGTGGDFEGGESVADALAELRFSASQCNSATVDPQLRVSTNQNPHTNDS